MKSIGLLFWEIHILLEGNKLWLYKIDLWEMLHWMIEIMVNLSIYLSIYLSMSAGLDLSLYLSLYIYIYIYIMIQGGNPSGRSIQYKSSILTTTDV